MVVKSGESAPARIVIAPGRITQGPIGRVPPAPGFEHATGFGENRVKIATVFEDVVGNAGVDAAVRQIGDPPVAPGKTHTRRSISR